MRVPLFGFDPGPEWEQSVQAAEEEVLAAGGDPERFEANKVAARDALQYDPRGFSRPFLGGDDDARVFTTKDVAAGYRLVVFFRMRRSVAEPKWMMVEWL